MSNLPEKFRSITCEIQELFSKKLETFLKIQKEKIKSNDHEWGFYPAISRLEVGRANNCTVQDLFHAWQKDTVGVDRSSRDCGESFS